MIPDTYFRLVEARQGSVDACRAYVLERPNISRPTPTGKCLDCGMKIAGSHRLYCGPCIKSRRVIYNHDYKQRMKGAML